MIEQVNAILPISFSVLFIQILERQNKLQKNNKLDEKLEESDNEGGLFDD